MVDFDFHLPTKILLGKNKEQLIGKELKNNGIKKVLLVYGKGSIKKSGLYDIVINSLKKEQIEWIEFSGVSSNPLLSHAYKGIKTAKQNKVDGILAVGGGSVIDESKPIAVGAKTDDDIWDYYTGKDAKDALPIFTVVTLAASCSYMNHIGVITHDEKKIKTSMKSKLTIPKISIINPELFFTLPSDYIAYNAVDTISHVFEPYFTQKQGSELQDGIMESIIRSTIDTTDKILTNHKDYNAWTESIWDSSLAHSGLAIIGVSGHSYPNHMCEHSISALYNIPHGAGLSIIIPAWMKWYKSKNIDRFKKFANKIFNINDADQGITKLENWFKKIKSPTKLSEVDIHENDLNKIKDNIMILAKLWGLDKDYFEEDILQILKNSL
jgi:alcohol dehydrogenase YqhD (iron-dependent ADH family)